MRFPWVLAWRNIGEGEDSASNLEQKGKGMEGHVKTVFFARSRV